MVVLVIAFKYIIGKFMEHKIDLLLVEPSLNWEESVKIKESMRIEKNIPIREGVKISTGYLLSSVKKGGYRVKFIDMVVEKTDIDDLLKYIKDNNPMVIGISSFTYQISMVGKLCSIIKNLFPHILLCVGGCHVSSLPKRTLQDYPDIDFIIRGEAETSMSIVLDRIQNRLDFSDITGVVTNRQEKDDKDDIFFENVNTLPFPAWEEMSISKYGGTFCHFGKVELPVITGRGCPFQCVFCCRQNGNNCRKREVGSVIEEIERNMKDFCCETISFMDETFILDKRWIYDFIEKMHISGLSKKIKWSCSTRVNSVSLDLLQEMKKAGCYYIFYGFESSNIDTLKIIKKGVSPEQMQDAVRWSQQNGIIPVGSFIIGLPGDTKDIILETIEFGKKLNLYSITFPIAVPFPGTELRKMALNGEYGMRIISDDWSEYLANDFDIHGKGKIGHLESIDLSWEERRELQRFAYLKNPKKEISKYLENIS